MRIVAGGGAGVGGAGGIRWRVAGQAGGVLRWPGGERACVRRRQRQGMSPWLALLIFEMVGPRADEEAVVVNLHRNDSVVESKWIVSTARVLIALTIFSVSRLILESG